MIGWNLKGIHFNVDWDSVLHAPFARARMAWQFISWPLFIHAVALRIVLFIAAVAIFVAAFTSVVVSVQADDVIAFSLPQPSSDPAYPVLVQNPVVLEVQGKRSVMSVEFFLNDELTPRVVVNPQEPTNAVRSVTVVEPGLHVVRAIAYTTDGEITTTSLVPFRAEAERIGPSVLAYGSIGDRVSGKAVQLYVDAQDDSGLRSAVFYVDGKTVGVDSQGEFLVCETPPPAVKQRFSITWDATSVAPGVHELGVMVEDTFGNNSGFVRQPMTVELPASEPGITPGVGTLISLSTIKP